MKIADHLAILYKPIQNESEILPILSMMKYIIYTVVVFGLFMSIVMLIVNRTIDYIVISGIVSFVILGYSLPRRNSRLVSGILIALFINGAVGAFLSLSFTFSPVNWIILMQDLLFAMLQLLMLVGTWFAFRSLQATFFTTE